MGCLKSKLIYLDNAIDRPLNYNLSTNDPFYTSFLYDLKLIEDARHSIVDKLDNLIFITSAYAFPSPDISSCIIATLYKIAIDNRGDIKKTKIKVNDKRPYLSIKDGNMSEDCLYMCNMLIDYINVLLLFKEKNKLVILEDKCKAMREKLIEKWKTERSLEVIEKKKRFVDTKDDIKLELALNCFVDLYQFYNEQVNNCEETLNNIDEYIRQAANVGNIAVNKKIKKLENIIVASKKDVENINSIKNTQKHDLIKKMHIKNVKIEKYRTRHEEF